MPRMSSHSVETLLEPVFGRTMPSYSHSVAPDDLPQPQSVSRVMGKPYSGAYFSFGPPGTDMSAFAAPWSSTESPVLDRHSPQVSDTHHFYRKESRSTESHPGYTNSVSKPGFTVYSKSPGLSSPQNTASVIVRKGPAGAESVSSDRPVYLTVPQAVYRHNLCCSDLCCVLGSPWKHRDPSNPQRAGPSDAAFSPGHTLPAVVHQTYSSTNMKEVSQSLQSSPRAYPRLYPSHAAYEPLIYHSTSPMTKYGHTPQHPVFYYSPVSVELERTETQNPGPVHTEEGHRHPRQPPGAHYMLPTPLHGDVSLPRREVLPNPAFLPGSEFPGYVVPRLNINTSPIHNHRHPRTAHSDFTNISPKHVQGPVATLASDYRDTSTQRMQHSSPPVHVEQTSPTACVRKSAAASGSQSHNRYGPPKTSVYMEPHGGRAHPPPLPHIQAPVHLDLDVRPSRYSAYRSYPNRAHISPPPNTILSNKTKAQKILYCPPLQTLTKPSPTPQPSYVHKGPLKRATSISSPIKITDDDDDVYVVEPINKRQKTDLRNAEVKSSDLSSPMPVINNVFSLAPYKTYLHMSRLLLGTLNQGLAHYSSDQNRTEESKTEDVKPQFVVLKSPPHRHTEPSCHCKDLKSDSKVMKREEIQTFSNNVKLTTLSSEVKVKQESPDEPTHIRAAVPEMAPSDFPKVKLHQADSETKIICKKEQGEAVDQSSCSDISEFTEQLRIIKKEPEEIDPPDSETMIEIKKCEPDSDHDEDENRRSGSDFGLKNEGTPTHSSPLSPPPLSALPHPERVNFLNIPPHCLKLSTYNIILPEVHLLRTTQKPVQSESPKQQNTNQSTVPDVPPQMPDVPPQMPVRKHFFELHQSLVKLISKSVAATSEDSLRSWLSELELSHVPSSKNQRVSCLFGAKGTNACLNEEMKSSLQEVYQRLNEYSQDRCPFPFVTRTGAIFLPMLVVKEVLFPSVHGGLIDQVLQEHKVELRPTTLSEEKVLIQMNKLACSSRLRRLMSYKHLPAVYGDVVNLLYYTCVCEHLGLVMEDCVDVEPDDSCAGPSSSLGSPALLSSPVPLPSPYDDSEELQTQSLLKRRSRIKRSSRRLFLGCSSDEEEQNDSKSDPALDTNPQPEGSDGADNSWMCPLTSGDLSADLMVENSNRQHKFENSSVSQFQEKPKKRSGVILKLRRTFDRKRMSYRPVLESEKSHLETDLTQEARGDLGRRMPEVARWKRTTFSNSLRPLNIYSKRKLRSLLTIKYCPYLSACHSADYRRRWVLRSAVQRARRAMKIYYPDLVGKRIQHLYEEDDKSEVWYRGEVLQIHKAHANPLKTVFEVRYDSEPEWKYYLELLIDYKKGWLKIED